MSASFLGISASFFDPGSHCSRQTLLNLKEIKHPHYLAFIFLNVSYEPTLYTAHKKFVHIEHPCIDLQTMNSITRNIITLVTPA